jgi:hypothetical protein
MQTFRECINIGVDARVIYLEISKGFASRGSQDIYPEALAELDAKNYEDKALEILKRLATSRTGRALFAAIQAAFPKMVLIRPVTEIETDGPLKMSLKTPSAEGWNAMTGRPVVPTQGFIANSLVKFTSDALDQSNTASPGMRSDEILFHELVHSLRHVTGQTSIQPMAENFDRVEEFMAVLVSNIFASEINRPLRGGHHGVSLGLPGQIFSMPLDQALEDPHAFLAHSNFRELAQQFIREHPKFGADLRGLANIKFNPIAAL